MKSVHVPAPSGQYEVKIGAGLLASLGSEVRSCTSAGRCVLVSGENVFPLYGRSALSSLSHAGLAVREIVFPAGENTKCLERYGELLSFLAENRLTRSDCIVALGGGVTGDLSGFAASTYQRGIPYIQVPTTLLSAVDSSVGGKTAINLPAGKNQVGSFYQPRLVLCDSDTLSTLPEREMNAGFAEVIKYAVLGDPDLFEALWNRSAGLDSVIETCVRRKAEIVAEDEHDTGIRRILNLGHTFGHAIESRSGYSLLHGEAVAVGLAMICRAAAAKGLMDRTSCGRVVSLLQMYRLPTETGYAPEELYNTLLLDKKISGGKLHLIVPREIGRCDITGVTAEELTDWLRAGLSEF